MRANVTKPSASGRQHGDGSLTLGITRFGGNNPAVMTLSNGTKVAFNRKIRFPEKKSLIVSRVVAQQNGCASV
jgi:hypothetical protein